MAKSFIISVINNKGGVGKTTVSCNLGHALTRHDKRVLVIDNDSQCNTTSLLLYQRPLKTTLYDIFEDDKTVPISEAIYPTEIENLYCLPNSPETAGLEPQLIKNAPESFFSLKKQLRDYALKNFDFTIIDSPPNLGSFVITSLYCADFVIVPNLVDSAFSLEGLLKAMDLISDVRENGNENLRFLRLLINQVDKRTTISRVALKQIQQTFSADQYFKTTIPINSAFKNAEHFRQTVFKYSSSAPGTVAYRKLAKELIGILKKAV